MKVIFSHGKESGPWGSKIKALAGAATELGCTVDSIDYTATMDPDERAEQLKARLAGESTDLVLVGSSMGGYVSLVAAGHTQTRGLFLMAPALYREGYAIQVYEPLPAPIEIVHGWADDVVAFETSVKFASGAGCTLHLIDGDHRLNDSLPLLVSLFRRFLEEVLTTR